MRTFHFLLLTAILKGSMFRTSAAVPLEERSVGVLARDDHRCLDGFALVCLGREVYLIDTDGRVMHEWRARRNVFVAHLLPNSNLIRDGTEEEAQVSFRAGGAAGYIEEVSWDNTPIWSFKMMPTLLYLSHHAFQPLANGNVLILSWRRRSKEECLAAGRRPDLLPDDCVWDNVTIEIEPQPSSQSAKVVWEWAVWDHLIQDFCEDKANFGVIREHPELFDINHAPVGGKFAQRNKDLSKQGDATAPPNSHGIALPFLKAGKTGEADWLHINGISYSESKDQIIMSMCTPDEIFIIDHSTTTEEAASHKGGRSNRGGDILWRWGNPLVFQSGTRFDQQLFGQHSPVFVGDHLPGAGHVLVFSNGRSPDRLWSNVLELELPECDANGVYPHEIGEPFAPNAPFWSYGPRVGRAGSFYCSHMSGCQRLENGNTLITLGPLGAVIEVTPEGDEVWRFLNPVNKSSAADGVSFVRQGESRLVGDFKLFNVVKYSSSYKPLAERIEFLADLKTSARYLEA